MTISIRTPRQVFGLVYMFVYMAVFIVFAFFQSGDQFWVFESKFTIAVLLWFLLSFAVKVSMVMNRTIELLNLAAFVAFMSIGFTYYPLPDHVSSIENLCYYLNMMGGSTCDLCDFVYGAAARRPKETSGRPGQ